MAKLTPTQREILGHCQDWSAAFEVAERRVEDGARTDWKRTQDVLMALHKRGLVEYHQGNATYRITDAGRAALSQSPSPKEQANADECFTVVFRGNLRKLQGNPMHFNTAFGPVMSITMGDTMAPPQEHMLGTDEYMRLAKEFYYECVRFGEPYKIVAHMAKAIEAGRLHSPSSHENAFRAGFELSRTVSYSDWREAYSHWSGATALQEHLESRESAHAGFEPAPGDEAMAGNDAGKTAAPSSNVSVPQSAIDWLFGEGPDANGDWFEPPEGAHRLWWRSHFRKLIAGSVPSPSPHTTGDQHPDDIAVDRFAAAMKAKLANKRAEGRGGWDNPDECSTEWLSELLRRHVEKGDPVDVGNFAMMIHQRGGRISK